jgi:hypothetical protein
MCKTRLVSEEIDEIDEIAEHKDGLQNEERQVALVETSVKPPTRKGGVHSSLKRP